MSTFGITNIQSFDAIKHSINDLDNFAQTNMKNKVRELNDIIDLISRNWQGANSEKYKKNVEEINQAIDEFRRTCLSKIIYDIDEQIKNYHNYEKGN